MTEIIDAMFDIKISPFVPIYMTVPISGSKCSTTFRFNTIFKNSMTFQLLLQYFLLTSSNVLPFYIAFFLFRFLHFKRTTIFCIWEPPKFNFSFYLNDTLLQSQNVILLLKTTSSKGTNDIHQEHYNIFFLLYSVPSQIPPLRY